MDTASANPSRNVVVAFAVTAIALTLATLAAIPSAVKSIFSADFLPHRYCYLYNEKLIALNVGTDGLIWLSYVAISCTLVYLVWRTRREIPFSWMFLAFGIFIVACGFTHFMEMVVLWKPLYWLSADVKLITALASVVTAIALPGLVPQIHQMVAAAQLSEKRRSQIESANVQLQNLSERVLSAQDEERRRIARELHDGIGQYLIAISLSCGLALTKSNGSSAAAPLTDALDLLDKCTNEVRTMSYLLHPPLLEEVGLASAIRWYVNGFSKRTGVATTLEMVPEPKRMSPAVELALFRVLQESLTNVHRHSESKTAEVEFYLRDAFAHLRVTDTGRGMDYAQGRTPNRGVGITGMLERVRDLGGDLTVDSTSRGTTVHARLPISDAVPSLPK